MPLLNLSPSLKMQRSSPEGGIHLTCHSCHNLFTGKPEILDWQVRGPPEGGGERPCPRGRGRKAPRGRVVWERSALSSRPIGPSVAQLPRGGLCLPDACVAPALCQDKVYQFCCRDCCEDFKRLRGVVSQCEHCKQEKLLHEKIRFSGVEKNFCSEGTRAGSSIVAEGRSPPGRRLLGAGRCMRWAGARGRVGLRIGEVSDGDP